MIDPSLILMMTGGGRRAAAAKAKEQEEEEEMTPYSDDDTLTNWEFKIIRSGTGSFGRPDKLAKVLEEEAKAGWELVEKFDDNRVRLRRLVAARKDDFALDFDPYRTWIGVSESGMVARGLIVSAVLVAITLAVVLLAM
jgi:hypothetical protein